MTSRFSRLMKQTGLNPLLSRGRKPRILPMSREDQQFWDERARKRREAREKEPRS